MKTLTKYLLFSFAVILSYSIIELIISTTTGVSHDTLTTCLYAFWGTEIAACCFIRIANGKSKTGDNANTDNEEGWNEDVIVIEDLGDQPGEELE